MSRGTSFYSTLVAPILIFFIPKKELMLNETPGGAILVNVKLLVENPDNPRLIKKNKFDQLVTSIMEFPQMLYKRPVVVVSADNGKYMALGGNMRTKAIPAAMRRLKKEMGNIPEKEPQMRANLELLEKGVPIMLADDWTEDQRREFIIKDNVSYGEHDWDVLANEWDTEVVTGWGLDIPDLAPKVTEPREDDYPSELPANPVTKTGDVYDLGPHRLICGDCRDIDVLDTVMNSQYANLCFTSPPYWVGKSYETEKSEKEIDEFIREVSYAIAFATEKDNGRVVINTGTSSIHRIEKKRKAEILPLLDKWGNELRKFGWLLRHLRIWVKRGQLPASISPKTDTIDQHNEFIGAFEKEWSQVLTFWEPNGEQRGQERIGTPWAQQGVWDDIHGDKSASGKHVAAFPVAIPFRNILLYTKKGEIVLDVFGGSGTTLIACDQLGRVARLSEISPGYCDLAVIRYYNWRKSNDLPIDIKLNGEPYKPEVNE